MEGKKKKETKRRNQCKPAQKIRVSCLSDPPLHFLTDFSCCWEWKVFTWGDLLSNTLRIWELPNSLLSYVLVIWKWLNCKISYQHFLCISFTELCWLVLFMQYYFKYTMFFFGILNDCMDITSLSTYYNFFNTPPQEYLLLVKRSSSLWNSVPPLWNKSHKGKEEEKKARRNPAHTQQRKVLYSYFLPWNVFYIFNKIPDCL